MSVESPTSDANLLDLLRVDGPMGVEQLADDLAVTATAVRQRLMRLLGQGLIDREAIRNGRGRPKHLYQLTDKGLRLTGSNFTDLALALWREIRTIADPSIKQDMVARVARGLAEGYADQVHGTTTAERMRSLSRLLGQRRIPATVDDLADKATMTTHACPYPRLAEQDRSVCNMEQMLYSQLLGREMELASCRLDGGTQCQFQAK